MQHIIKKQSIELTLGNGMDHFRVQQLASNQYWTHIVPILEKTFNEKSNGEEVIALDKLEIDLGVISLQSLEKNEWVITLQKKVDALLAEIIANSAVVKGAEPIAKRISVYQQWFFYMQRGYLPWNTITVDEAWHQLVLEALAVDYTSVQVLREAIQKNTALLQRLVAQHDKVFLLRLTEIFTATKQDELMPAMKELVMLLQYIKEVRHIDVSSEKKIQQQLWQTTLSLASSDKVLIAGSKIAEQLTVLLLQKNVFVIKDYSTIPPGLKLTKEYVKKNSAILKQELQENNERQRLKKTDDTAQPKVGNDRATVTSDDDIKKVIPDFIGSDKTLRQQTAGADELLTNSRIEKMIRSSMEEEGIFVNNAGVVLLHPFLHALFSRLQIVNEGKFADKQRHQLALHVLHYLATGNVQTEEHELVIGKILTDHPLQEAVEEDILITPEIADEAEAMLQAAIEQWEKLKGTSAAGLREGFLQRKGKLFSRHGNLYLQLEQSAIDILLDYLPWNLGMIKLPWMQGVLRVEWR